MLNDECEEGLILELAFVLRLMIFPPGDSCPVGQIYIVSRGAALFQGRAYTVGTTWGEGDALLTSERLRFPIPASALSYLFTYGIDGDVLRATMSQTKYPEAAARMRHKQVIWIVRRGIVRAAEDKLALHNLKFKKQRGSLMGGIARAAVQAARQGRRLQRENTGERLQQGGRPARDKRHSHEDMGRRTRVPSHERFDSNVVSMARGDFGSSSYGSPAGGGKVDSASFKKTQDALSLLQRDVDELKRSHFEDAVSARARVRMPSPDALHLLSRTACGLGPTLWCVILESRAYSVQSERCWGFSSSRRSDPRRRDGPRLSLPTRTQTSCAGRSQSTTKPSSASRTAARPPGPRLQHECR